MGWHAALRLDFRHEAGRTVAHHQHEGPLRVLKALYPEGPGICHHVIVHPPAGIVGGDSLRIDLDVGRDAHALLTTPGAARFYRSAGPEATQTVSARLQSGARLEWLPSETLVYSAARASNQLEFQLDEGAQMIGWDLLALGLPAAELPFARGRVDQRISVRDNRRALWLEQGRIAADDQRLLQSPLGLHGRSVLATLWWASGSAGDAARLDDALGLAREAHLPAAEQMLAGATLVHPQLLVWRGLAHRVEPLMQCMRALRGRWRESLWDLEAVDPRLWST